MSRFRNGVCDGTKGQRRERERGVDKDERTKTRVRVKGGRGGRKRN